MQDFLKINDNDNVVVALNTIPAGEKITVSVGDGQKTVTAREEIPAGHKMAIFDIPEGGEVIKYGYRIGNAKENITEGSWIHTHNVKTALGDLLEYTYNPTPVEEKKTEDVTFMGFNRPDGKVGVRNEIWVIPTVGCVNNVATAIAKQANAFVKGSVEEVIAFPHPYGCSQMGDDQEHTRKILADLINHPNAGGVLVLGLGCENSNIDVLKPYIGDYDENRVKFLVCQEHEDEIEGTVKLEFQPAEEIGQGARPLIAAGMLDGAQRVFGLHTASDLPAGTVGVKPGANNAGVDHFIIRIHGKSAHVSTPQLGVDALYIASELVVALQSIVTRMTSPVEPVLIGVGKLNAGTAYNAVAETAVLEGTTRMFSPESRAHLRETINAAAAHISALYGGTAEVEWDDFATPLTNDAGVCGEVERVADALGIPTTANRALSLSGDDFAEYLLQTKGAYAYLGTANPKKPHTCISNHRGDFDIDEETLPLGAALYAAYALSVLDPQFAK